MKGLVPFECPCCKRVVYATPGAEVGHVCRNKKPRTGFVASVKKEAR